MSIGTVKTKEILDFSQGASLIILVVLDLVCDIANGALTCAAMVTSS